MSKNITGEQRSARKERRGDVDLYWPGEQARFAYRKLLEFFHSKVLLAFQKKSDTNFFALWSLTGVKLLARLNSTPFFICHFLSLIL
jgi:hypothetical protein